MVFSQLVQREVLLRQLMAVILSMLRMNFSHKRLYYMKKKLRTLIELNNTEMQSDSTNPDSVADAFLASTLRYIQFQKQKGGVVGEKFNSVKL
ncbi:hypothetical protein ES319_D11G151200v1 [Gossypium barbadense]|uniref:Uncharacterized protein n=3 Tax=Gossypium TaxID=3633 RepID=A0A5J5PB26_GOSBA|nr:hypothetical protein ES319_D11G151200v1 [Gossypium barbadense]TYG45258.1 hypothetical protein ES288_D11G159400v1 [Gossypium darwinii]TYH43907.1 hypothetical protein ES332_D11G157300v1 [Gossypium tomentosum]